MNQIYIKQLKAILLFFTICLFISCANGQTSAEKYFFQAYECKDLECQLNFLNKSIEANPEYAPAYWGRANVYFFQNKHKEKQADFVKAEQLSPDYGAIYFAYETASKTYPNNKYALVIQGDLLMIPRLDDQALKLYNQALKLDSKFASAYLSRGIYYEYQEDNKKALEDFAKAIELEPKMATAYFRHGSMLATVFKEFDKGIAELDKAIQLPAFNAAYNSRAVAYKLKGDNEKAISDLSKSIEIDPSKPHLYRYRASIYKEIGKTELAEKDEAKAKELESKKSN